MWGGASEYKHTMHSQGIKVHKHTCVHADMHIQIQTHAGTHEYMCTEVHTKHLHSTCTHPREMASQDHLEQFTRAEKINECSRMFSGQSFSNLQFQPQGSSGTLKIGTGWDKSTQKRPGLCIQIYFDKCSATVSYGCVYSQVCFMFLFFFKKKLVSVKEFLVIT